MEIKEVDTLMAGDVFVHHGNIWSAERQTLRRCSDQCGMFDPKKGRCSGFCCRLDGDGIVFRHVCSEFEISGSSVIKMLKTVDYDSLIRDLRSIRKKEEKSE